jgi:hypothetical protein
LVKTGFTVSVHHKPLALCHSVVKFEKFSIISGTALFEIRRYQYNVILLKVSDTTIFKDLPVVNNLLLYPWRIKANFSRIILGSLSEVYSVVTCSPSNIYNVILLKVSDTTIFKDLPVVNNKIYFSIVQLNKNNR